VTDVVRVWIIPCHVPQATLAMFAGLLDDGERARAVTFKKMHDQRLFTIAHGAVRMLAGRAANTSPAGLTWIPGAHGKPELMRPWSSVHTSVSHSGDLAAVAVTTGRPVGVDIQQLVPGLNVIALSARFFPPAEASYVAAGHGRRERADRFARLWVRKEAAVKSAGGRLWPNLTMEVCGRDVVTCTRPAGAHRVAGVTAPGGYHAAVALAGPEPFTMSVSLWADADADAGAGAGLAAEPARAHGAL
jgi:4'-phosphopantetheinyl transferase